MPTLESFFTVFGPRYDLPAPLIDQTVAGAVLMIFGKLTMSIAASRRLRPLVRFRAQSRRGRRWLIRP